MPLKSLRVALSNIMLEVQRLDALLPATMLAISESPLPKGDYTIEATKGLFSTFRSGIHSLTRADKVQGYEHFYDDYCIAHYLLGLVAKQIAFFPEEVFDQDMCSLAVRSFKTVFRYAPYILDDTYAYYFAHYNLGLIMMQLGQLDDAEAKFKYLLSTVNPTLLGLPALAAGKGRNSLEVLILAKAHAALFLLNEDRATAAAAAAKSETGSQKATSRRSASSTASSVVNLDAAMANLSVIYKQQQQQHQLQQQQQQQRRKKSSGSGSASRTTSGGSGEYGPPTGSTAKLTRDFKDFPTIAVYHQGE